MTLHEAIIKLLKEKSRSMTTSEIADDLNQNKWYKKKDGTLITPFQIHGRTRNYPQFFKRQGSQVALADQSFDNSEKTPQSKKIIKAPVIRNDTVPTISIESIEPKLLDEVNFQSAATIEEIPKKPGLYCIKIKSPSKLPKVFTNELTKRGHNIIYIGKASKSLQRRLVDQELRAKGHGTFFRSIGAVLGYLPPKGSLIYKKNKRNYKFSALDEVSIIDWINSNLLINWVEYEGEIEMVELELIIKHKPLLNIDGNPSSLGILRDLRSECVKNANQK